MKVKDRQIGDKDSDMTFQQLADLTANSQGEFATPWGNVKMRRKMFCEPDIKDEAATIIQSRKF